VAREELRAARAARELRRALVATTIRFYYDATIAIALTCVFALVVSLIAAVIVGGSAPSTSVAIIVFALTGAMLLLRWWRGDHRSASRPANLSHLF
jgi:membrane protein implicated in regulation of membrane protease activity